MKFGYFVLTACCLAFACGGNVSGDSRTSSTGAGGAIAAAGGSNLGGALAATGGSPGLAGSNSTGGATIEHQSVSPPCEPVAITQSDLDALVQGACAGIAQETEGFPADIVFLVDRSAAMAAPLGTSPSRWQGVRDGIAEFLSAESWIPATVRFFELADAAGATTCDAANYGTSTSILSPPMPGNGSILGAFDATSPTGPSRPTATALAGALEVAAAFKAAMTTQPAQPIVVLITAGMPDGCGDDLASLVAMAASASQAGLSTYVVQLGADFDLNPVASASSTAPVYLIDSGDVATGLYDVLHQIVTPRIAPVMGLPQNPDPGHPIDFSRTLVTVMGNSGSPGLLPHLSSEAECSSSTNGGWYLDATQSQIVLCTCTQAIPGSFSAYFFCQ